MFDFPSAEILKYAKQIRIISWFRTKNQIQISVRRQQTTTTQVLLLDLNILIKSEISPLFISSTLSGKRFSSSDGDKISYEIQGHPPLWITQIIWRPNSVLLQVRRHAYQSLTPTQPLKAVYSLWQQWLLLEWIHLWRNLSVCKSIKQWKRWVLKHSCEIDASKTTMNFASVSIGIIITDQ